MGQWAEDIQNRHAEPCPEPQGDRDRTHYQGHNHLCQFQLEEPLEDLDEEHGGEAKRKNRQRKEEKKVGHTGAD